MAKQFSCPTVKHDPDLEEFMFQSESQFEASVLTKSREFF